MTPPSTTTQTNHIYGSAQINTASGDHSTVHAVWNLDQSQKNQLQTLGTNLIQVATQSPQPAEKILLIELGEQLHAQAQLPAPDKGVVTKIWSKLKNLAEPINAVQSIHDAVVAGIAVLGPIIGGAQA